MSDGIRMSATKQLRAIRATVASVIAQLDALEESIGRGGGSCVHPEEDRKSLATFDAPDGWQCGRCGHIGGQEAVKKEG